MKLDKRNLRYPHLPCLVTAAALFSIINIL